MDLTNRRGFGAPHAHNPAPLFSQTRLPTPTRHYAGTPLGCSTVPVVRHGQRVEGDPGARAAGGEARGQERVLAVPQRVVGGQDFVIGDVEDGADAAGAVRGAGSRGPVRRRSPGGPRGRDAAPGALVLRETEGGRGQGELRFHDHHRVGCGRKRAEPFHVYRTRLTGYRRSSDSVTTEARDPPPVHSDSRVAADAIRLAYRASGVIRPYLSGPLRVVWPRCCSSRRSCRGVRGRVGVSGSGCPGGVRLPVHGDSRVAADAIRLAYRAPGVIRPYLSGPLSVVWPRCRSSRRSCRGVRGRVGVSRSDCPRGHRR